MLEGGESADNERYRQPSAPHKGRFGNGLSEVKLHDDIGIAQESNHETGRDPAALGACQSR
jgi:hypothetical protein